MVELARQRTHASRSRPPRNEAIFVVNIAVRVDSISPCIWPRIMLLEEALTDETYNTLGSSILAPTVHQLCLFLSNFYVENRKR